MVQGKPGEDGRIIAITDKSGHYETSPEMVINGLKALREQGVDLNKITLVLNSHPFSKKPLEKHNALTFLMRTEMQPEVAEIFQGVMNRETAENLLKEAPVGTWLLRFSEREKQMVLTLKNEGGYLHKLVNDPKIPLSQLTIKDLEKRMLPRREV